LHDSSLGKVRCGNKKCRQGIGGAQQFIDRPGVKEMFALKCKRFKFSYKKENGDNRIDAFKRWTDATIRILELEPFSSNNTVPI
jgi:hypothetical protein